MHDTLWAEVHAHVSDTSVKSLKLRAQAWSWFQVPVVSTCAAAKPHKPHKPQSRAFQGSWQARGPVAFKGIPYKLL